jgi:hypothetical protein
MVPYRLGLKGSSIIWSTREPLKTNNALEAPSAPSGAP